MSSFPEWLEPMAATLTDQRFTGPEWIFERKLDGIRMLAFKQGSRVQLLSRNRLVLTAAYPSVAQATKAIGLPRVRAHWVKPEVVVQVAFTEWTVHGKLRHPRLLGLRDDKPATDVIRERA